MSIHRGAAAQTIAIDGPAGAGKSTVARLLAIRLRYLYFDTGVLYRALTLIGLRHSIAPSDERSLAHLARQISILVTTPTLEDGRSYTVLADGEDVTWEIRSKDVDANVSVVSAWPSVRSELIAQQRNIAAQGQVVMVGRDVGTVVLPEADLKIFLDASVEERARRRIKDLHAMGRAGVTLEEVLQEIRYRDRIDTTRGAAPLRPAEDAIIIDTTNMTIAEVVDKIVELAQCRE